MTKIRFFSKIVFFVVAGLLFSGVQQSFALDYLKEKQSRPLLGTIVHVTVCYVDGRQDTVQLAMDRLWQRLEEINARMNKYSDKSDVSLINQSKGRPVAVHEDVYRILALSEKFREITNGVFDITVGPLVDLWQEAAKEDRYPSREEIAAAKKLIGTGKVELLSDNKVRLTDPAVRIDLNGIVSGFAADEAVKILKDAQIHNFLVDTGGELYAAGVNCQNRPWRLGVKDPENKKALADSFELSDAAVSTSGDYEHFVVIKGQKWSHIVNPLTGYPQNGVASGTVIAPTTVEADVFSKPVCILGPSEGLKFVSSLGDGYDALILLRRQEGKYEWYTTPGYEARRFDREK
ncbi:MAG: FAD:protein FMN transferase [Candidatus Omnitrophica bacterium]|nr:FAD:protein FMN transferase [Candidatus Omnitrophota bacterium]